MDKKPTIASVQKALHREKALVGMTAGFAVAAAVGIGVLAHSLSASAASYAADKDKIIAGLQKKYAHSLYMNFAHVARERAVLTTPEDIAGQLEARAPALTLATADQPVVPPYETFDTQARQDAKTTYDAELQSKQGTARVVPVAASLVGAFVFTVFGSNHRYEFRENRQKLAALQQATPATP